MTVLATFDTTLLLRTTGRAIETSDTKTDWVWIAFDWHNGEWRLKEKDDKKKCEYRTIRDKKLLLSNSNQPMLGKH